MIPGWPYSIVAALETGRTSWTALLDAIRLQPGADVAAVTTAQIRDVVERRIAAGQWRNGDPEILVVLDAGYDAPRIAYLLGDLLVQILGRMRSDRVLRRSTPPRVYDPQGGGPPKHGGEFVFGDPATWATGQAATVTDTVIRLQVDHLPSGGDPNRCGCGGPELTPPRQTSTAAGKAFLRRFDIEHTFRLFKQTLGWTAPKLRDPEAADRWTGIVIAAHTQLRLARPLAADLRRPWEKPLSANKLTPQGSAAGSGTSAPQPHHQPAHQNHHAQAPDDPPTPKTGTPPPATTSGEPSPQASHTPDPPTTKAPNPGERFNYKLKRCL